MCSFYCAEKIHLHLLKFGYFASVTSPDATSVKNSSGASKNEVFSFFYCVSQYLHVFRKMGNYVFDVQFFTIDAAVLRTKGRYFHRTIDLVHQNEKNPLCNLLCVTVIYQTDHQPAVLVLNLKETNESKIKGLFTRCDPVTVKFCLW